MVLCVAIVKVKNIISEIHVQNFYIIFQRRFAMPMTYPLLRIESIAFMAVVLTYMRCNPEVCGLATWSANQM